MIIIVRSRPAGSRPGRPSVKLDSYRFYILVLLYNIHILVLLYNINIALCIKLCIYIYIYIYAYIYIYTHMILFVCSTSSTPAVP